MKIYVVGIGPGGEAYMTPQAKAAISESNVVVGYQVYLELVRPLLENKTVIAGAMLQEVERCQITLNRALSGDTVSLLCSGVLGIYGMAGLMLEVAREHPQIEIVVVPGVTAACSAAAILGAPLMHDFAVISLSDLLTPWETIKKRLLLASQSDFVVCLYNPGSKSRAGHLKKACRLMLTYKEESTPCGLVQYAGRDGETKEICTLGELVSKKVDMFTTVIVGNSATQVIHGRLVTPRGYQYES